MPKDILSYTKSPKADLWAGWNHEGKIATSELCGGHVAPDFDILVDDEKTVQAPKDRTPVGPARIAWVARDSIRSGPYGARVVIASKYRFSGANRHKKSTMRTIALFHEHRDDPVKLENAAMLASIVALGNDHNKMRGIMKDARDACLAELGLHSVLDVWTRTSSAPLARGSVSRSLDDCASVFDVGRLLRHWHIQEFERYIAVSLTPIIGGVGLLSLSQFEDVVRSLPTGRNAASGSVMWKKITDEELADLIWKKPVQAISKDMNVSGAAISKRCDRASIQKPPRGYWQQLQAGTDPRDLLLRNGIIAPSFVQDQLAKKFDLIAA
jgi:hypothetical protein